MKQNVDSSNNLILNSIVYLILIGLTIGTLVMLNNMVNNINKYNINVMQVPCDNSITILDSNLNISLILNQTSPLNISFIAPKSGIYNVSTIVYLNISRNGYGVITAGESASNVTIFYFSLYTESTTCNGTIITLFRISPTGTINDFNTINLNSTETFYLNKNAVLYFSFIGSNFPETNVNEWSSFLYGELLNAIYISSISLNAQYIY